MHISFDQLQNQSNTTKTVHSMSPQKVQQMASNGAFMMDQLGQGQSKNNILFYGNEKEKSLQDVQGQASIMNGSDYKNYMAVMSHTMSEEDYKKLTEDGVHPGKTEVSDAANIMDHIKANMAEAGVVIDGFNAKGDLSVEMLTEITNDAGYANAIAGAFTQNDVPLTEENAKEAMEAFSMVQSLNSVTDEMKQYLLANDLPATIDEVYKATYSASGMQSQGGYFADDTSGYYGKKPQDVDKEALNDQVEKMLLQDGIEVTEENKNNAFWLLDKGILLTKENMQSLSELNQIEMPIENEKLFNKIAGSIREGKTAVDTNLAKESIFDEAKELYNAVQEITDEAIKACIKEEKTIHIRSLSNIQKQIALSEYVGSTEMTSISAQANESFLHEKRMLEEVRLKMTVSANIQLLKSNYAIDTAPLTDLVEALKVAEQKQNDYGFTLSSKEETALYQETMEKRTALMDMPAAVIPKAMSADDYMTLRSLHEQGSILKSTFDKAGESYEALMTKPRADLGDRMKNAFGNIDELLSENNMESNEETRRAVRILAYNQMEISQENIVKVVEADQKIKDLLLKMSPANTLQMIRDGINPLDESIDTLSQYFDKQENNLTDQAEKFSQFLYQMEQKNEITKEERDSFIGIYRLVRQIEKQDGKAIGRVVADGREMSFNNLLSALRTGQKKPINITVDDSVGMLSDVQKKGISIADQINSYFELMKESETNEAYVKDSYLEFRQQMETTADYVDILLENNQLVTPDHLKAMKDLTENRGQAYRSIKEKYHIAENENAIDDMDAGFDALIKQVQDSFVSKEQANTSLEEMAKEMSEKLEESMFIQENGYLDVKEIASLSKQLSLITNLAQEEAYEIPAVIDGEMTSAFVKVIHEDGNRLPNAKVTVSLTDGRQIMASFTLEETKISGFIGCNEENLKQTLLEKQEIFSNIILSETEKTADIQVIKSDILSQVEQNKKPVAGKQGLLENQNQAKEDQGGYIDASALYKTVRAFMRMVS